MIGLHFFSGIRWKAGTRLDGPGPKVAFILINELFLAPLKYRPQASWVEHNSVSRVHSLS